jgi:hypothetical protein
MITVYVKPDTTRYFAFFDETCGQYEVHEGDRASGFIGMAYDLENAAALASEHFHAWQAAGV